MDSFWHSLKKKSSKKFDEDNLVDVHHIFMKEYGWIPFKEMFGELTEHKLEYEIPIMIHTSRGNWIKDLVFGKIESIQMVQCKGKISNDNDGLLMPTMMNLINCINKDKENEKKELDKAKKK